VESFLTGTTCKELVHEIGRHTPRTTKELLDIATNFASGDEAVGAIFQGRGKQLENPNDGSARRWFDKKKKSKKGLWDNLVATTDRNQGPRPLMGQDSSTRCLMSRALTTRVRSSILSESVT
jgi:hypothetical protein